MFGQINPTKALSLLYPLLAVGTVVVAACVEPRSSHELTAGAKTHSGPVSLEAAGASECTHDDTRPACHVQSRGLGFTIRPSDPNLNPYMCLTPKLAGTKGAEYERVMLTPCTINSDWIYDLVTPSGAENAQFSIRHLKSGRCLYVEGGELRLRPCTRDRQTFWGDQPVYEFPGAYQDKHFIQVVPKMFGPQYRRYCIGREVSPLPNSNPEIPSYGVKVAVQCPMKAEEMWPFLWAYKIN
ncbi:hypothetical protein YTPLAS18_07600 [Nitrospira sp.]|nr:hypothetical protein YTPLAS18_07600 [Nitrospira sp.]